MTIPELPPLEVKDRAEYERYYRDSGTRLSDMCFTSRFAWGSAFSYRKIICRGGYCLISDGGVFTAPHITMPLGRIDPEDLRCILDHAAPWFEAHGWDLRMMYIDEPSLPLFQDLPGYRATLWHDDDFSDYIYDAASLRTLPGKPLHGQRNHVARFLRENPGYEYRSISASDRDDCLRIVEDWCREKGLDLEDHAQSDFVPIRRVFDQFDDLAVRGGVLRTGGRTVAFSIGSEGNGDTAVIHFEKADASVRGAYAAINRFVVESEYPTSLFVNREEDMGNEGIRTSKQSYGPREKLRKFNARLERM